MDRLIIIGDISRSPQAARLLRPSGSLGPSSWEDSLTITAARQETSENIRFPWNAIFLRSFITIIRLFLNILRLNLQGNKKMFFLSKVYFHKHWKELNLTTYPTQLNVLFSHNFVFLVEICCFSDSSRSVPPFPFTLFLLFCFQLRGAFSQPGVLSLN